MGRLLQELQRFFRELKRRNVYKVAGTYAVVAFVGFQTAKLLIPSTVLPPWTDEFFLFLLIIGFPVAVVVAWAFELTPEGVRRTRELEEAGAGEGVWVAPGAADREGSGRLALKALAALGLVGAAVAGTWYLTGGGGERPEVGDRTLAVLPFRATESAADPWRDGMVSILSTKLDGAAGFRAIADRTVFAAWEEGGLDRKEASVEETLAVARRVGAQYALFGSASQFGQDLHLTAQIYGTRSGDRLGGFEVSGRPDSVASLADSLARLAVGTLIAAGGEEEFGPVQLGSLTTGSFQALKAYLQGERRFRAGDFEGAVERYRAAVSVDSAFALAHWRLGSALAWIEGGGAGNSARGRAHELSHRLPVRERRLLHAAWLLHNRDQGAAAADTLRRIAAAYPDDPAVWSDLGEAIFHGGLPGGWPAADSAFRRAVELDPGHGPYHIHLLQLAVSLHRDSALAAERAARHRESEVLEPWFPLAMGLVFGDSARRRAAWDRLDTIPDPERIPIGYLGGALFHPRDHGLEETLALRYRDRDPLAAAAVVHNRLRRGRIRGAVTALESVPEGPLVDDVLACGLADAVSLGYPLPDSVLRRRLGAEGGDAPESVSALFCRGVYLAETGREEGLGRVMGRLEELAPQEPEPAAEDAAGRPRGGPRAAAGRPSTEPDPAEVSARRRARAADALDVLRGYRAWRAGDLAEAARRLSRSVHEPEVGYGGWRGIWRGDVYRELGELREAEGWYLTAWIHPLAHQRLGRLYEEMGRPEQAADAYRRFVEAWEGADEPLRPRVEEARARLQALDGRSVGQ